MAWILVLVLFDLDSGDWLEKKRQLLWNDYSVKVT